MNLVVLSLITHFLQDGSAIHAVGQGRIVVVVVVVCVFGVVVRVIGVVEVMEVIVVVVMEL